MQGITNDVTEAMPKTLDGALLCCSHSQIQPRLSAVAAVIDRMVRWGVLPASVRPDSVRLSMLVAAYWPLSYWPLSTRAQCIINIYEEADCAFHLTPVIIFCLAHCSLPFRHPAAHRPSRLYAPFLYNVAAFRGANCVWRAPRHCG